MRTQRGEGGAYDGPIISLKKVSLKFRSPRGEVANALLHVLCQSGHGGKGFLEKARAGLGQTLQKADLGKLVFLAKMIAVF